MKRTIIIRTVAAVVIAVLVVGTWIEDGTFDVSFVKLFSAAVLVATIVLALWDVWLWRVPIVQRIPGVPRCIRGTWKGTLTSHWIDPATGKKLKPKSAYLVVRQTATLVSAKLLTDESRSMSSFAEVAEADGECVLRYLYFNRPDLRVAHRSPMHHGSVVLNIAGAPAKRLKGHYWTDRGTKGELEFIQYSSKIADDLVEAAELFEVKT